MLNKNMKLWGRSENFSKHIFFNMSHQRPSNGECIAVEKDFFLDIPGAQGSHPKTGLSNIGKTHLCP
jgi:hypothetical protein